MLPFETIIQSYVDTKLGVDKYFILSEQGKGQARADHIFSSFLCFAWSIRDMSYLKNRKKKLGKTSS